MRSAWRARSPAARSCSSSRAPTTATSTACSPRPAPASPPRGSPAAPACTAAATATTITIPWNDRGALERAFAQHEFAAVLFETVPANMGVVPAKAGFLASLRLERARNGALLIADEVITGFRVARGGGQELLGARPRSDDHGQDRRRRPAGGRLRRAAAS